MLLSFVLLDFAFLVILILCALTSFIKETFEKPIEKLGVNVFFATLSTNLPLPRDPLLWHFTSKSMFTVRFAYHLAKELESIARDHLLMLCF